MKIVLVSVNLWPIGCHFFMLMPHLCLKFSVILLQNLFLRSVNFVPHLASFKLRQFCFNMCLSYFEVNFIAFAI